MLSKTAMLLVPAASLVGAAALAPTSSLAYSGDNHGFIAVNYPYCQENPSDSKCQQDSAPAHSKGAMQDHRLKQRS
jgi:hypothetical protein